MATQKQIAQVREIVKANVAAYEDAFGIGPCGGLAVVLSRAGWGKLAVCESNTEKRASDEYAWYPHYVVVPANENGEGNALIDVCGEYAISDNPSRFIGTSN